MTKNVQTELCVDGPIAPLIYQPSEPASKLTKIKDLFT